MCELCNPETRNNAAWGLREQADNLENFAAKLRQLANGDFDPHTYQAIDMTTKAHHIIRYLAQEWL